MASLVRIGDRFVNLDRITHVQADGPAIRVYFSEGEAYFVFTGDQGDALRAYLSGMAIDVLEYHRAVLAEQAEEASRKRLYEETTALLESCTDPGGHAWWPNDETGWDCVHCAAYCGLNALHEVIIVWGGEPAKKAAVS